MTKLEKIEQDIASLSLEEIWKLADWFAAHHADLWDSQIEEDAKSGRLDKLMNAAELELAEGNVREFDALSS